MISFTSFLKYLADSNCNPELLNHGAENHDRRFTVEWSSRNCSEQSLFLALPGARSDGHTFIEDAYKRGCRMFLLQRDYIARNYDYYKGFAQSAQCIVVNDVKQSLLHAAKAHRAAMAALRIGITGSVGKTSTKEWLAVMLKQQYTVLASQGNLNTVIAIAARMLTISRDTDIFICELGIDKPGEMEELVDLVMPHCAVITSIGSAHIGNYASQEELAHEKSKVFSSLMQVAQELPSLRIHPELPAAWVPDQRAYMEIFSLYAQKIPLTIHPDASPWKMEKTDLASEKMQYTGTIAGHTYSLALDSSMALYPLSIAISLARSLDVIPENIQRALENGIQLSGRGNTLHIPKGILINDSYNASFESMMGALLDLAQRSYRKHSIAILAPMNELGEHSDHYHTVVLEYLARSAIKDVILIGELWLKYTLYFGSFHWVASEDEALKLYHSIPQSDQLVLLKGSRSYALENLIDRLFNKHSRASAAIGYTKSTQRRTPRAHSFMNRTMHQSWYGKVSTTLDAKIVITGKVSSIGSYLGYAPRNTHDS